MFKKFVREPERIVSILSRGQLQTYQEKETLYTKGEDSDYFYLIVFGSVTLYQVIYN